jgi:hypothetical protein
MYHAAQHGVRPTCFTMINRRNDLNIETSSAVLIVYGIDVFASMNNPLRVILCSFIRYYGMHVAHLVHSGRVGDENNSNFSV